MPKSFSSPSWLHPPRKSPCHCHHIVLPTPTKPHPPILPCASPSSAGVAIFLLLLPTWSYANQLLAVPGPLPEVVHTILQIMCAILTKLWEVFRKLLRLSEASQVVWVCHSPNYVCHSHDPSEKLWKVSEFLKQKKTKQNYIFVVLYLSVDLDADSNLLFDLRSLVKLLSNKTDSSQNKISFSIPMQLKETKKCCTSLWNPVLFIWLLSCLLRDFLKIAKIIQICFFVSSPLTSFSPSKQAEELRELREEMEKPTHKLGNWNYKRLIVGLLFESWEHPVNLLAPLNNGFTSVIIKAFLFKWSYRLLPWLWSVERPDVLLIWELPYAILLLSWLLEFYSKGALLFRGMLAAFHDVLYSKGKRTLKWTVSSGYLP